MKPEKERQQSFTKAKEKLECETKKNSAELEIQHGKFTVLSHLFADMYRIMDLPHTNMKYNAAYIFSSKFVYLVNCY